MGSTESKSLFLQSLESLGRGEVPEKDRQDVFWESFWSYPVTEEDIFAIVHPFFMRGWREKHPETLAMFLKTLVTKLNTHDTAAEVRERCIVLLKRLAPFCLECDPSVPVEDTFAGKWLFSDKKGNTLLGTEIVASLLSSLFTPGYTLSNKIDPEKNEKQQLPLTSYTWAPGVFVDTTLGSSVGSWAPCGSLNQETVFRNRACLLRALLAWCCGDLFCPSSELLVDGGRSDVLSRCVKELAHLSAGSNCRPFGQVLFASLLNTVCSYNPSSSGASETKENLVQASLQLLCVMLTWKHCSIRSEENELIKMIASVDNKETLGFVATGIIRLIDSVVRNDQAFSLFSSFTLGYYREAMIVLWALLVENKHFSSAVVNSPMFSVLFADILFFVFQGKQNGTLASVVHLCGVILLLLSESEDFACALNKKSPQTLPFDLTGVIPGTSTLTDVLILLMSSLFCEVTEYDPLLEMFLIVLSNSSSGLQGLSFTSASKLIALIGRLSRSKFLVQSPRNSFLLTVALDIIDNVLQSSLANNPSFVYVALENEKLFRRIAEMTPRSILDSAVAIPRPKDGYEPEPAPQLPPFATEQWYQKLLSSMCVKHIVDIIQALLKETQSICQGEAEDQDRLMDFLKSVEYPSEIPLVSHQMRKYEHGLQSAQWVVVMVWSVIVLEVPPPNPFKSVRVSLFVPAVNNSGKVKEEVDSKPQPVESVEAPEERKESKPLEESAASPPAQEESAPEDISESNQVPPHENEGKQDETLQEEEREPSPVEASKEHKESKPDEESVASPPTQEESVPEDISGSNQVPPHENEGKQDETLQTEEQEPSPVEHQQRVSVPLKEAQTPQTAGSKKKRNKRRRR